MASRLAIGSRLFLVLAFGIVAAGCRAAPAPSGPPATPTEAEGATEARQALLSFLTDLNQGRFEQAASAYSGPYDAIQVFDPSIAADDHVGLLRNACTSMNLRCLAPRSAVLQEVRLSTEYVFAVEFSAPDGTLFVRGPCCGATETEMPSQSVFTFHVIASNDGKYSVQDLPPYVP